MLCVHVQLIPTATDYGKYRDVGSVYNSQLYHQNKHALLADRIQDMSLCLSRSGGVTSKRPIFFIYISHNDAQNFFNTKGQILKRLNHIWVHLRTMVQNQPYTSVFRHAQEVMGRPAHPLHTVTCLRSDRSHSANKVSTSTTEFVEFCWCYVMNTSISKFKLR